MARGPRDRLNHERDRVRELHQDGTIDEELRDALLEFSIALDDSKVEHQYRDADDTVQTYAQRSVERYLQTLRTTAADGLDLLTATPKEFNDVMARFHDEQGKSKSTLSGYQVSAQKFFRYYDVGDPDEIEVYSEPGEAKHDETDMFTEEEVERLRRACGQTKLASRNRALLELLIYTGQRLGALLTLKLKHLDLQDGYLFLNDEYAADQGGLKNALSRGRKRPMFGARKFVRDWVELHPEKENDDAWLFIGDPNHWKTDTEDHWAPPSADGCLRRIGEYADVDKPVNAHNFRHYCATVLYRDYDLDKDTIRMLFGHVETSRSLEETYTHVFDEDYIRRAEVALGYEDAEEKSPFTPESCPTCGELLEDHWRQCPNCQEVFGPVEDIEETVDEARDDATGVALSEDLSAAERSAMQAILSAVDDPSELAAELTGMADD